MKKALLLLTGLALATQLLSAQQTSTIRATLTDASNGSPIPGAVIELSPAADSTVKKHYTSVYGGAIEIPDIAYGSYRMKISFLGYDNFVQGINVNRPMMNLGRITLTQGSTMLDAVVAETQAMRTSQKGDTLVYNAAAFKVTKDADTEALLSKMPGIKITNGEVEAQGETVKKVFVDGKEFFGEDVNAAIKNLPAEVVSKVEVYNKLSDQAEFTGTDDGEGFKAINIVTTVSSGQFGRIYGGYGFNDKYMGGANVNIFSGDSRITIMGMANNVNQQNFSTEDILGAISGGSGSSGGARGGGGMRMRGGGTQNFMVAQQDGISTVQSFALNYSDKWGKKIDFSGNYFFNNSKNENDRETYTQYTTQPIITDGTSNAETRNMEHRFSGRMNYKINDNHSLMWRPSVSFQNYRTESQSFSDRYEVENDVNTLQRSDENRRDNHNWGYTISSSLTYRVKLGKTGRTLSTDLYGNIRDNERKNFTYNLIEPAGQASTLKQSKQLIDSKSYNLSGNVMYTEPVAKNWQLNARYRIQYRYSDYDKKLHQWQEAEMAYNPDFDPNESSIYNSGYLTQSIGPGFNYNKDRDVITGNISYQRARLMNDQDFPEQGAGNSRYSFDNVVYFAMMNKMFNPGTSLRIHARSSTSNPSVTDLQSVPDRTDQTYISAGNHNLKPSYSHNMFAHFIKSNATKGRTFMLMAGFTSTSKYMADSTVTNAGFQLPGGGELQNGQQFTKPINMNGNWRLMSNVSYGIPLKFIKSNLNINLGAAYNEAPSMINELRNIKQEQNYNAGLVLGSNISENIDFTVSYNGGYNIVKNSKTLDGAGQNGRNIEYFSHVTSVRFKWIAWAGFTLSGSFVYSQERGVTEKYNEEYMNCNLYLGKKLFKSKRGEIIFGVNDLFDQKSSYKRTVYDNRISDVKNNVIGRYFGFQFVYNLRSFGKQKISPNRGGDSMRDSNRPMGPPPGGFGGGHGGGHGGPM